MGLDLLFPVLLLAAVLAAAPVVLWVDARGKRLSQRVEVAMGLRQGADTSRLEQRSIRLTQSRSSVMDEAAYRTFRIPLNLPSANVLPIWLVFALALGAGVGGAIFADNFISRPMAIASAFLDTFLIARGFFGWELKRYQDTLLRQMPDAIELVVSGTRAGLPVAETFRALSREMPEPTREEFRRANNEMSLGTTPDEALMNVHRRTRVTEYAIFAVTLGVQSRSGGRIAEAVQNLADIIRQRVTIAGRAQALSAEARLSARIMCALPFAGGGVMSFLHPGYLTPLFYDPRGKQMFVIGFTALIIGMLVMRRMVSSVGRE